MPSGPKISSRTYRSYGHAAHPRHDLAEHVHAGRRVIAGAGARLVLRCRRVDPGEVLGARLAPRRAFEDPVGVGETRGVGEQVPDRDAFLAGRAELGKVAHHGIVGVERTALPLLRHRDRRDGLRHGEPGHHRVGAHLHVGTRAAEREVGDDGAAVRDVQLGADVGAVRDALFEHVDHARVTNFGAHVNSLTIRRASEVPA